VAKTGEDGGEIQWEISSGGNVGPAQVKKPLLQGN